MITGQWLESCQSSVDRTQIFRSGFVDKFYCKCVNTQLPQTLQNNTCVEAIKCTKCDYIIKRIFKQAQNCCSYRDWLDVPGHGVGGWCCERSAGLKSWGGPIFQNPKKPKHKHHPHFYIVGPKHGRLTHFTVFSRESINTLTQILVRIGVCAHPSVLTGLMSAAVI